MNQPEIRVLSEADVDSFWQLRLRALQEEPESFGASYEESVNTPVSDVLRRLQTSDHAFVFGAFMPNLIGMVGLYRQSGLKDRHKGNIWGMYVAPDGRGNGAGRALMASAIARARLVPCMERLLLAVVTTKDAARRLYLSLGFEVYGVEREALKIGDSYFDEELMALKL